VNTTDFKKPDHWNLTIPNFTFYFGLLLTAIVLSAVIILSRYVDLKLEVRDYITLCTSGAICTTLAYHSKNVALTYQYHLEKLALDIQKLESDKLKNEKDVERKKLEYTFYVSNDWFKSLSECVQRSRVFINNNRNNWHISNIPDFISKIESNPEDRKALISVLNYFEYISLLIKNDLVHEETIKSFFKTVFCEYFSVLKPYIDERQKVSRRYLLNYEEIALKWSKD
jgi:hypothetical protein